MSRNEQRQGIIVAMVSCLLLCIPYIARFGSIAAYVGKKEGSDIGGSISVGGVIYSVQQIEV